MTETKTNVYFAGIPTEIDVRLLMDTYPTEEMKIGDEYPYSVVAGLIQCDVKSNRFGTVTTVWRRKVENLTGNRIGARGGECFWVMTDKEKLEAIESKETSVFRQIRKNIRRIPNVDRKQLNEDEKKRLDHKTMNARNLLASKQQRQDPEQLLPKV